MLKSLVSKLLGRSQILVYGRHSTSSFRKYQNLYLREYCSNLGVKTILNIGAHQDGSDKEGKLYKDYFPDAEFYTMDLCPSESERHIVADIMDLSNVDQQFDLILLMSVLEHVEKPFLAAEKLRKLMPDGGYLYFAVPFFYPVHEGPHFGDFWRFTPASVPHLFDYCDVVKTDYHPTVIRSVADRRNYWNEKNSCYTSFSSLLKKRAESGSQAA